MPVNYSKKGTFFVSKEDYSDLRVSFSNNSEVNYWLIKKNNIQIEQYFEGGKLNAIHMQEFTENQVKEIAYERSEGRLKLVVSRLRRPQVSNFSELNISRYLENQKCSEKATVFNELGDLNKGLNDQICQDNLENKIIAESCKSILTPENYKNMIRGMAKAINLNNKPSIGECIKNEKTAQNLAKSYQADLKIIQDKLKIIGSNYDLNSAKAYKDPDSMLGKISCKLAPTAEPIAQTIQGKGIVFYAAKNQELNTKISKATYNRVSVHEMIHSSGVELDRLAQDLTAICVDGVEKVEALSPKDDKCIKNKGCFFGITSQLDTQNIGNKVASNTRAIIPKELAETAIKNPEIKTISQPFAENRVQLNDLAISEGAAEAAYQSSTSMTSGLFNTTSKLLSAVSGGSIIPSAQASTSTSRLPSSVSERSGSKISKPSVVSSRSGEDTFVAEEILAPDQSAKLKNKNTAEIDSPSESKAKAVSKSKGAEGVAPDVGVSAGGALDNLSPLQNTGSSKPSAGRNPASTRTSGIASSRASSTSRINADEVKTYLKNYEHAKARLMERDPVLLKGLEVNGIKIVDPTGKIFGPSNGSIIYQDTGRSYEPL